MSGDPRRDGSTLEGLLLDVEPVTRGDRTVLKLWVRTADATVTVLDPDFEPYFFCVPQAGRDASALASELANLSGGGRHAERAEVVVRERDLADVEVVRVWARHPGDVPALREVARSADGVAEVLEADVPYHLRYLIDKDLRPMDGLRCTLERDGEDWIVRDPTAYELGEDAVDLKILAFDLEVHNPHVSPNAKEDPVILIGVATSGGRVEVLAAEAGNAGGQTAEDGEAWRDDRGLLQRFVEVLREEDPDVIVTYNGDNFDWPYLEGRFELHGMKLAVGRDGSEPDQRQFGPNRDVRVHGRQNVDLYRVADRDLPDVKVKTLENVAEHLGVMAQDERAHVPGEEIHAYWEDPERRRLLKAYARDDVVATLDLGKRLLPLQAEFARRTKQPVGDVSKMGRGRQVDWYLVDAAHHRGLLVPNRGGGSRGDLFEGGFVLEPPKGLHEDIQALDFSAMYPSIMIAYNISPDTVVTGPCDDCYEAPAVGHRFRKEPDGFFRAILQDLTGARRELKARLREHRGDDAEARLLDVRQLTLKVLTNSFYGYMGWNQARWYSRACAEATTAWGRHLIQDVIKRARDQGIEVLYGDTDSLFVRFGPKVEPFVAEVNRELPLELEVEERYEVIFFTGAKKRYAGLTSEGEMVVKGLEVRRGDWCALAQRIQQEVLDIVLRERDPERALERVQETVRDLKGGDVPVEDLKIYKTLTMKPGSYKVKGAHVRAVEAAKAQDPSFEVPVGAKVAYVILQDTVGSTRRGLHADANDAREAPSKDRLSDRAKLVEFLEDDDILDADYYIDKQVVPAALRILEHFDFREADLKGEPRQRSLFEF